MRISLLQENLQKSLSKASRIIVNKPQLPILSHVLLIAKENSISITTTNIETSIRIHIPGKILEEGEICVPARLFLELVSSLSKETVILSTEAEVMKVECGKTKASLPGVTATEFPPLPDYSSKSGVDIPQEILHSALSCVLFASANDETRPLLTGIRVENSPDGTTFVATDGYRLSMKTIPGEKLSETVLVIPARALQEIVKITQEEKELPTVRITETVEGQLLFTLGDTFITTRRIEGEYPNFRRIIPASYTTEVSMQKTEVLKAVKSAAIFARDNAGIIRFTFTKDGMTVSANTPQVGENTIDVDATVEGEEGSVAINSRFLLDLLQNFPGEEIQFQMTGSLNPTVFKVPEDSTYLHIIMPVRVQS